MPAAPDKSSEARSHAFKIIVVILLTLLTTFRLLVVSYFPYADILPDELLLLVLLVLIFYLWTQELRGYSRLRVLNKVLCQAHEALKRAEIDTIASLVKAEEARDKYTRGHSERVTAISLAIAGELGLDEQSKSVLERAGILHDIGKIGIDDAILHKKEKLTDEEWVMIKSHPEKAIKILTPLKFLGQETKIILSHHERYDGKGYPRGLKAENIPIEALILAVADAFDAMNSERPYRRPLGKEAIIAELIKGQGSQHSPKVVEALFSLLDKRPDIWQCWTGWDKPGV